MWGEGRQAKRRERERSRESESTVGGRSERASPMKARRAPRPADECSLISQRFKSIWIQNKSIKRGNEWGMTWFGRITAQSRQKGDRLRLNCCNLFVSVCCGVQLTSGVYLNWVTNDVNLCKRSRTFLSLFDGGSPEWQIKRQHARRPA